MSNKCAILLGSPEISGGTFVIFQHVVYLMDHGWEVTILTKEFVDLTNINWHPAIKRINWSNLTVYKGQEYDLTIATWCMTMFDLFKIKSRYYAYFIQSIESRFFPEYDKPLRTLVNSTYLVDIPQITIASWMRGYLKDNYGGDAYLVRNGLRKDLFNINGVAYMPKQENKLRVLVEGSVDVDFKNVPIAIELAQKAGADEIWLLTPSDINEFPGVDRVFSKLPIKDTPKVYRSCDVLVKLSYVEGMFGPPLEMFACGGTAICYDVTGFDEYIRDGYNAVVIKRDDEEGVVKAIQRLKIDRKYFKKLLKGAQETSAKWSDWEISSKKFTDILQQILKQPVKSYERSKALMAFEFETYIQFNNLYKEHNRIPFRITAKLDSFKNKVMRRLKLS